MTFVLDTKVLSAMMSARPGPEVAAWIAGQPDDALFTTTICQAEILSGLAMMPEGRRRLVVVNGSPTTGMRRTSEQGTRLAGTPTCL